MEDTHYNDCESTITDVSLEKWKEKYSSFYKATLGDEGATKDVINGFMKMVHMWAHKYESASQSQLYEDLVQEGIIGILTAITTFDIDKRTAHGKPICPSTWVWWKIRASVQTAFRKHHAAQTDTVSNMGHVCDLIEDTSEDKDLYLYLDVEGLLVEGCGSLDSRRAQIIKDKYGLFGRKPLKQWEISRKYSISKQATSSQIAKFFKRIRSKYPELKEEIG
jgi:RNA polymerase sigma factor (sigma-70 family)